MESARHLPALDVKDLPEPPDSYRPLIGPGVVAAGVGLASGEFVLWPYIASQAGLVLLWGAAVGIGTQWFLNMEIERYTLATGETALTGFSRLWKHWGLVFVVMIYFANLWPGWATASATMLTYLVGGEVTPIAIGMLVIVGAALTFAPVIYVALERLSFVKIAAVILFIVMASAFVISREAWAELPRGFSRIGEIPPQLGFALVMGAFAFAGAGGGQNLCQSNWIRDKGFGMGAYVPRLVSPITGEECAAPSTGFTFEPTAENMGRWRRWWRMANVEQAVTFAALSFLTIVFMSMVAYSTVHGRPDLPQNADFLRLQGEQMEVMVGAWFRALYWIIGVLSLFVGRDGHRRLHQPHRRRRAEDQLPAAVGLEREPDLLRARLGPRPLRLRDPGAGVPPADGPAGGLVLRRRAHDVHLLGVADRPEPAGIAGADPDRARARRGPGVVDGAVRPARRAHDPAAAAAAAFVSLGGSGRSWE